MLLTSQGKVGSQACSQATLEIFVIWVNCCVPLRTPNPRYGLCGLGKAEKPLTPPHTIKPLTHSLTPVISQPSDSASTTDKPILLGVVSFEAL